MTKVQNAKAVSVSFFYRFKIGGVCILLLAVIVAYFIVIVVLILCFLFLFSFLSWHCMENISIKMITVAK